MDPDFNRTPGTGATLQLMDGDGKLLKTLPIATRDILDAALGRDGKVDVIPRGEESCYAAYDAEGRLLHQRGVDFDRLTVTLPGTTLRAGTTLAATAVFRNALQWGLLFPSAARTAALRAQSPRINAFLRGSEWSRVEWTADGRLALPAAAEGSRVLRFTPVSDAEGSGPRVVFKVILER
ncbi:MAG TPA: hypothetical protein VE981_13980 [Planctomycetota bacterium]|nr:hypothetical protein [Planctomycetota bacterium]